MIVTSNGTVSREEEITLTLPGGRHRVRHARRVGSDDRHRGAPHRRGPPAADRADATALQVGKLVLALGRPGGERDGKSRRGERG
ncbi:MAG TPA: hypothetical protein VFM14_18375 [Gemmatimonadales bacterium]|nr:hypothetical protein [Gemmatimonadales bacterium]